MCVKDVLISYSKAIRLCRYDREREDTPPLPLAGKERMYGVRNCIPTNYQDCVNIKSSLRKFGVLQFYIHSHMPYLCLTHEFLTSLRSGKDVCIIVFIRHRRQEK